MKPEDIFDIILVPDPVLRSKAQDVPRVTPEIKDILAKMHRTMMAAEGVGLAANQVNLLHRLCIIDTRERPGDGDMLFMVNPRILWRAEEESTYKEGCLSIPGHYADVSRPSAVIVSYLDEHGQHQELRTQDPLLNAAVQHEIDHLDGVLFIDHISRLKRDMIMRKMTKLALEQARGRIL